MALVAIYKYFYGAGTEPNRYIEFWRNDQNQSLIAQVKAMKCGNLELISTLNADEINVEMMTTSEKVSALKAERAGQIPQHKPNQKLSELSIEGQEYILTHLEPQGDWRIGITNDIGDDPTFEKVVSLALFNPS